MESTRLQKIERLLQKELSDIFQKQTHINSFVQFREIAHIIIRKKTNEKRNTHDHRYPKVP